ncbi:hypothetical protein EAE96_002785 [Botrytis aclada]|nr:hypothetical protein EAE96_002785 [Botrytis aclada]
MAKSLLKISIIVCGKHYHTQFYSKDTDSVDSKSNGPVGTVVDHNITKSCKWDFFLQPHQSLTGTVRPCHYFVIRDEIFKSQKVKAPHQTSADFLEELTHNMCYLFGRVTKAVSLCLPIYYADLLYTRIRAYLTDQYDSPTSQIITMPEDHLILFKNAVDQGRVKIYQDIAKPIF